MSSKGRNVSGRQVYTLATPCPGVSSFVRLIAAIRQLGKDLRIGGYQRVDFDERIADRTLCFLNQHETEGEMLQISHLDEFTDDLHSDREKMESIF